MKKILLICFLSIFILPLTAYAQNCSCYNGDVPLNQNQCTDDSHCTWDSDASTCECTIVGNTTDESSCTVDRKPVKDVSTSWYGPVSNFACEYFSDSGTGSDTPPTGSGTGADTPPTDSGTGPDYQPKTAHKLTPYISTDINKVIGQIIKYIIGISGSIALLIFIYGGLMWMISAGRNDYVAKGKKAIINSVIGLIVIFSSYIVVKLIISALGAL